MKILVVGGGGREHAIIKSLKKNKLIETVYALPGNGGISSDAICVDIGTKDINGIVNFATENRVDYAVVAPDDPLVLGAVDALEECGIPCFGPNRAAAIIEGSKAFAKELMKKYSIPTARYETFDELDAALKYLEAITYPTVIKADGLALGKGVIIAENKAVAESAVKSMMTDKIFGESGSRVIIEEFLECPEVSVLAFTDGHTVVPMISSMDHKRARDNDKGLNTGGMGTVAPNPCYTEEIQERCMKEIFIPTVEAMKAEGRVFKGCLYFGLMITKSGPKVIEYNCRFGDPETQVVLPLLKTDLFSIMQAVTEERLSDLNVEFSNNYACCVIMASKGYPEKYDKGYKITIPRHLSDNVYVAGAQKHGEELLTAGGRVLGAVATADNLEEAIKRSYSFVEEISFENAYYRRDIGKKALAYLKKGE